MLLCKYSFAQDPHFSQFYSANLYLAPSFAGSTPGGRAAILYRNQWPAIRNQFNTYNVSIDHYFPKYHSGVGLFMIRDEVGAGKLVSNSFQLQYSYTFRITRAIHAKPGIQMGYITRGLDLNKLVFGDQLEFEQTLPSSIETGRINRTHFFDYAASMLLYIENAWIGASLDHLPFPNESMLGGENSTPLKLSAFGGIRFVIKKRLLLREQNFITFSYLYKEQSPFKQLDIGGYYTRYPIEVGIWYRGLPITKNPYSVNHDALVSKVGLLFDNFNVGYSYDFTFSKLRSVSGGAHEISIVYLFNQFQRDKKRFKALPCPVL